VPGFEDQVISSYVEVAYGNLVAIREHARRNGHPVETGCLLPADAPEIVQLVGMDNGFLYALVLPALLRLADPNLTPPNKYLMNEFYLLEGSKFSTSRGHAIWIRDICEREPSDLVRFYLCHTRPEHSRTDFTEAAYREFVDGSIRGDWVGWLEDLDARLRATHNGAAPEPGYWMNEHRAFLSFLDATARSLRQAYSATSFSTRHATRALLTLVDEARTFAEGQRHFAAVPDRSNELRTALALELAAAHLLALGTAPIMPRFAERLFRGLGSTHPVGEARWPEGHGWVADGTKVDLREVGFPPRDE
jgi:methionyl-tRNA synthetase